MVESLEPPVSGLVAGKYEVVRLIGRGGMGSVWEGRHASLGTRVAIKFIDQEYTGSKEAQTRFVNEARAAASIQSKHAIHIHDHGVTEDGRPYMVMELLDGEPLDKRIERLGRLSLQETARILVQVCRGLQRAHDAGIIHRDLKPENIFLVRSPDDDDEIAKVLDFGIAKIKGLPGEKGLTSSTKTGAVLGTPYYMSPEQARGLRTIDHRSDLWSLGVIAYKCLTGVLPFEGESVGDLLVKICTSPVPVPSMTMPGLPPAFDAWFARTLDREPARRFASASELAEALAVSAGLSVRRAASSLPGAGQTRPLVSSNAPPPYVPSEGLTPPPAAGLTSAPFVTSAQPPKSGRGALFALLAAVLIGGTVGVVAVLKLFAPTTAAHPLGSAAAAGAPSAGPSIATPSASLPEPTPGPSAHTATVATTPTVTTTAAPHPVAPHKERPASKPAPHETATASHTSTTPAPTKPPTVKLPPTSSDPGY